MRILHNVYQGFTSAIHLVVEKNRKNNLINRIKYVIRQEETKANQAYIALGKYYFNHLRQEENEETEFYCKAVEHANHRIDRALTKLDELTLDAEDFFCDEDFDSACEDLGYASCENAEEASDWDYTETVNDELAEKQESTAKDTLSSSDFPSDEEIVQNVCDAHGSCGDDYNRDDRQEPDAVPSEAASDEENRIPVITEEHQHPCGGTEA